MNKIELATSLHSCKSYELLKPESHLEARGYKTLTWDCMVEMLNVAGSAGSRKTMKFSLIFKNQLVNRASLECLPQLKRIFPK